MSKRRIIYIVKSDLAYYPPCLSQIRMIHDLGIDIEVWFGSSKVTAIDILETEGIPYVRLTDPRGILSGSLDVLSNWLAFRQVLSERLKGIDKTNAVLWFGTAESAMPMIGALNGYNYIVSALELYDDVPIKRRLLGILYKGAIATTACEISRAYIMRSWWNLATIPYVFPNKPYGMDLRRELPITCNESAQVINDLKGREYVIYQGILQNEEYVTEIAKALKVSDRHYPLVLMGIDRNGMASRIRRIYNETLYYESIPAPKHLEVTSRAHIGIVFYDGANLNKAFCAPNKIYEYSSFGMPILANRMPGLVNTVGAYGCAECIDLQEQEIVGAIERIDANYSQYSSAAKRFFSHTDNLATMQRMLGDLGLCQ